MKKKPDFLLLSIEEMWEFHQELDKIDLETRLFIKENWEKYSDKYKTDGLYWPPASGSICAVMVDVGYFMVATYEDGAWYLFSEWPPQRPDGVSFKAWIRIDYKHLKSFKFYIEGHLFQKFLKEVKKDFKKLKSKKREVVK